MDKETLCGCSECVCSTGGYQVHVTITEPDKNVIGLLEKENVELITITNYTPFNFNESYVEYITSKNYKKLDEALLQMCILAHKIDTAGGNVIRQKLESHPKNNHKALYKEVHYKIEPHNIAELENYCFFSRNKKGTLFATQRFFEDDEVCFRMPKYVMEGVIYDSNLDLDKGISRDIYRAIPAARLEPVYDRSRDRT